MQNTKQKIKVISLEKQQEATKKYILKAGGNFEHFTIENLYHFPFDNFFFTICSNKMFPAHKHILYMEYM